MQQQQQQQQKRYERNEIRKAIYNEEEEKNRTTKRKFVYFSSGYRMYTLPIIPIYTLFDFINNNSGKKIQKMSKCI